MNRNVAVVVVGMACLLISSAAYTSDDQPAPTKLNSVQFEQRLDVLERQLEATLKELRQLRQELRQSELRNQPQRILTVFPLKQLDAAATAAAFQQLFKSRRDAKAAEVDIAADTRANTLMIMANLERTAQVKNILRQMGEDAK